MGVSVYDASGTMRPFPDLIRQFNGALSGLTQQQRDAALATIFGADAVRAANVVIMGGADAHEKMVGAVTRAGAGADLAGSKMKGLGGAFEGLKSQWETVSLEIGERFLPVAEGVVRWAADILPYLSKIPADVMVFGAAFGAVLAAVGPLTAALGGLLTLVGFFATPFGLATLAVAAFAGAYATNLGGLRDITTAAVQGVTQAIGALAPIVQKALSGDVAGAFEDFRALVSDFGSQLGPAFELWKDAFVAWITPAASDLLNQVATTGASVVTQVSAATPAIASQLLAWGTAFVAWVAPMIPPLLAAAADMGAQLLGWVAYQVPPLVASLAAWATSFIDWIAPMVPGMLSAASQIALGLIGWVASQIPGIVSSLAAWGAEFIAWVAPQIPPLLSALGGLLGQFAGWMADTALPAIVAQLVVWGTAFMEWIGPATLAALREFGVMLGQFTVWFANEGLPAIRTELAAWGAAMWQWIVDSGPTVLLELGKLAETIYGWMRSLPTVILGLGMEVGKSIVQGMIEGADGDKGALTDALKSIIGQALKTAWDGAKAMVPGLGAVSSLFGGSGGSGGGSGGGSTDPVEYLRQAAAARGIDPDQVTKVMMKEGPTGWGAVGRFDTGTSYGPLQLHYAGGSNPARGIGDDFTRDTGIDLRVDQSIQAQQKAVDYALDRLAKTGDYREWYGADPALGSRFTKINRVQPVAMPDLGISPSDLAGQIAPVDLSMDQTVWGRQNGLTMEEAAAVCGPYAAYLFAQATGRTPTAQEAIQLARQVGWTTAGMRGPASQVALLGRMGIGAVQQQATAANLTGAIQGGSPGLISTPKHIFYADQVNEAGQYRVGATGTTMPGGKTWMTLEEMGSIGGGLQSIIVALGQTGAAAQQMGQTLSQAGQDGAAAVTQMHAATGATVQQAQQAVMGFQGMQTSAQGLAAGVAQGTVSMGEMSTSLVQMAAQAGVNTTAWDQLQAGTITTDAALAQVMSSLAQIHPGFAQLQQSLTASGASSEEVANAMLQSLAYGAAPTVSQAMAGLAQQLGNQIPGAAQMGTAALMGMQAGAMPLFQEVANGSLSMSDLSLKLVELASQTGVNTTALAGLQAGTLTADQALNQVVDSLAVADPQFAALASQVTTTDQFTRGWMSSLVDLAAQTSGTTPVIAAMTQGVSALEQDVSAGNVSFHDMAVKLAELASQTGLTQEPLKKLQEGVADDTQAVKDVIQAMADSDPAFSDLRSRLDTTSVRSENLANVLMQYLVNGAMPAVENATPGVETALTTIQTAEANTATATQALNQTVSSQYAEIVTVIQDAGTYIVTAITDATTKYRQPKVHR